MRGLGGKGGSSALKKYVNHSNSFVLCVITTPLFPCSPPALAEVNFVCAHSIFPCQGHGALIDTDAEHLKAGGEGAEPGEALEPGPSAQPHGHGNLWFFLQRLVATKKP